MPEKTETAIVSPTSMAILDALREWGLLQIPEEKIPEPETTLEEIFQLYLIAKIHLLAVIAAEMESKELNIKDVMSLTREMEKLTEMLFNFKKDLAEKGTIQKPEKSEIIMGVISELSEQERLKIGKLLREKYKILEEEQENGSEIV